MIDSNIILPSRLYYLNELTDFCCLLC